MCVIDQKSVYAKKRKYPSLILYQKKRYPSLVILTFLFLVVASQILTLTDLSLNFRFFLFLLNWKNLIFVMCDPRFLNKENLGYGWL